MLVQSSSDLHAAEYYLYNRAKGELRRLGGELEKLDPAQLGKRELRYVEARDTLAVPVYVTVPNASSGKNLPLVVLVEPNPFRQSTDWTFDRAAQFLASRGYAVLQPHPRGTAGYGKRHLDAGKHQWGLGMQDDIADAVKWAVGSGLADPQRVCIAGTAYGGYAAMMGLVRHPELYRCAISWSGITDIEALLEDRRAHGASAARITGARPDPQRLRAVSPLWQAAKIRKPVLLAYGETDSGVPLKRGRALYEAIRAHNQHAEWLAYDKGNQRAPYQDNRIDFWTKVEAFLARHLSAAPP